MSIEIVVKEAKERLDFYLQGASKEQLFTSYKVSPEFFRPYFFPVNGPSGQSVTSEINEKESHHRSLWIAHGSVNGHELWLENPEAGRLIHREFMEICFVGAESRPLSESRSRPQSGSGPVSALIKGDKPGFSERVDWVTAGGELLLREERRVQLWAEGFAKRFFDFDLTFTPALPEVVLGQTGHALLSIRMRQELSVDGKGKIVSSTGGINEPEIWGKRAEWCDYSGPVNGTWEGITIFDHPQNIHHPPTWFARNYGFMSANFFKFIAPVTLKEGESLRLQYRVSVHSGDVEQARVAEEWKKYKAEA